MIGGRSVLAVVPARGGSKGLPGKNLLPAAGRPLLAWTLLGALEAQTIDAVVVSSDSEDILDVAEEHGVQALRRPAELARDDTPGIEPVLHALATVDRPFDVVICLQPTSPLRRAEQIDGAMRLHARSAADTCVSIAKVSKPPEWMFTLDASRRLLPWVQGVAPTRRQDASDLFVLNGAIYISHASRLVELRSFLAGNVVGYVMDRSSSLDIDDELDLAIASFLLSARDHDG